MVFLVVIHAIVTLVLFMAIIPMIVILLVVAFRELDISTLVLQEEVVAGQLLLLVHLRLVLVDTWSIGVGVPAERDVQVLQELVATGKQAFRSIGPGVNGWLAVKDDDTVGEIGGHDEIVLDDERCLLAVHDESFDDSGGNDTLLGVEVRRRLINEVDICRETECKNDSHTLKFTTR